MMELKYIRSAALWSPVSSDHIWNEVINYESREY